MRQIWLVCWVLCAAQEDVAIFPALSLSDLISHSSSARAVLRGSLQDTGLITINAVPGLKQARSELFVSLESCHNNHQQLFETVQMADGTVRDSLASATVGSQSYSFEQTVDSACPAFTSSALTFRTIINEVTNAFLSALNSVNMIQNVSSAHAMRQVQTEGQQLEHFRIYSKNMSTSPSSAMDFHVDEGLFIALTAPLLLRQQQPTDLPSGLLVRNKEGKILRVAFPDESAVVFMAGDGLARWMQLPQYKAVFHALDMPNEVTRYWYGRMILPATTQYSEELGLTFGFYRQLQLKDASAALVGCMQSGVGSRAQVPCDNATEYRCWMQCYSPAELPHCGPDQPYICVSNSDGSPCDPEQMGCGPRCGAAPVLYCDRNTATAMFMDGFTSPQAGGSCVIFLFDGWTMHTKGLFVLGCFGAILMGAASAACIRGRNEIKSMPQLKENIWGRRSCDAIVYGLQMALSYLLMLVAMTYSTPLFICVIFGLMLGQFFFNNGVGGTPCCDTGTQQATPATCCSTNYQKI